MKLKIQYMDACKYHILSISLAVKLFELFDRVEGIPMGPELTPYIKYLQKKQQKNKFQNEFQIIVKAFTIYFLVLPS